MTRARDLAKGTFSGDLTVDTNTLVVDSANNKVGIGTASPSFEGGTGTGLEINNSSGNGAHVKLTDAASGSGGTNGFDLYAFNTSGYIENYEAGSIVFRNGGTERMRIDSSGNVGIGTSSPTHRLDVLNDGGEQLRLLAWDQSASARANIDFWYLDGGGSPYNNAQISTLAAANAGNGNLVFSTRPTSGSLTERMRIDSSGALLVGTTVVGQPNANAMAYDTGGMMRLSRVNGNTGNYIYFIYNGLGIGSISNNGGSAVSYNTSSDYRLKTDAQPMVGASDRVLALKPVNFEWISDGTRVDGFLAHEAQAVVPECVTGTKDAMRDEQYEVTAAVEATYDEDGNELTAAVEAVMGTRSVPDYQGIDQSKLVPLLTAALQEALTKIAGMETRLAALEAN